jgi:hypothetical protein
MNQRIANLDNFQQLWDFYTTKGGMGPEQAAGMLGNIYAESRGNTGAVNPGDGADGSDSFGMLQWNAGRRSALDAFAKARGKTAADLLTQAEFSLLEGQGNERRGFMQGMNAETPEDAALGFAQGYIRPAAQHIPQRAGYGRMFYDIFQNGAEASPTLGFSREHAASLDQRNEAQQSNPDRLQFDPEVTGGRRANPFEDAIMQQIMQYANPFADSEGPQPPMVGPRTGFEQDEVPQLPTQETPVDGQTSPPLGEPSDYGMMPFIETLPPEGISDEELDAAIPTGEGNPPASRVLNEIIGPLATEGAYSVGLDPADAPTTVAEVTRAVNERPSPEDSDEEAERKNKRRLLAADMLETLSVGLGQLGSGQAVNLGQVLQNQQQRRVQAEELEREEARQQQIIQERQGFAQQLADMDKPQLAQLAMSGEAGYKAAMSVYETILSRQPDQIGQFNAMPKEARYEVLKSLGLDDQTAAYGAEFPDIGADILKDRLDTQASETEKRAEGDQLLDAAMPYISDPGVKAAARRLAVNPSSGEAQQAMQQALTKIGADLPSAPMSDAYIRAAARHAGLPEADPMVQAALAGDPNAQKNLDIAAEKSAEERGKTTGETEAETAQVVKAADELVQNQIFTPTEGNLAKTAGMDAAIDARNERLKAQDAALETLQIQQTATNLASAFPQGARRLFANIKTEAALRAAIDVAKDTFGMTEQVKTAMAASNDPIVKQALIELNAATSGKTLTDTQSGLLKIELDNLGTMVGTAEQQRTLSNAMSTVFDAVTQPGYTDGGSLSGSVGKVVQNVLNDLFGDGAEGIIVTPEGDFNFRLIDANIGQYFQNFRGEGSGAVSDMESRMFMQALPQTADNALKQAGLAQRIIREAELNNRYVALRQDWLLRNDGDPVMQMDVTEREKWIKSEIDSMGLDLLPVIDLTSDDYADKLRTSRHSGNIEDNTVIRVTDSAGNRAYMLFREFNERMQSGEIR